MEKNGKKLEALAVWLDIDEKQYDSRGKFQVTGQIYGTDLEVTGTVKVFSGNEKSRILIVAIGITAGIAVLGVTVFLKRK